MRSIEKNPERDFFVSRETVDSFLSKFGTTDQATVHSFIHSFMFVCLFVCLFVSRETFTSDVFADFDSLELA